MRQAASDAQWCVRRNTTENELCPWSAEGDDGRIGRKGGQHTWHEC